MTALKEDREVSTTTNLKCPFTENLEKHGGVFYEEEAEFYIDDLEPVNWDEVVDPNDGSWTGKRGSNKNPTQGVRGPGPKTVKK